MFSILHHVTRSDIMGHAWTVFRNMRRTKEAFPFAAALRQSWLEHRVIGRQMHVERSDKAEAIFAVERRLALLNGKTRWQDGDYPLAAQLRAEQASLMASI